MNVIFGISKSSCFLFEEVFVAEAGLYNVAAKDAREAPPF
jgi:hypothetical protein